MCGRFTLHHAPAEVAARFEARQIGFDFGPRYNVAPTQPVAAITVAEAGRVLEGLRWGLVPFWAKDLSIGSKMINARLEGIETKPAFRSAVKSRRCIIVADGFYEWQVQGKLKQPFHFRFRDGRLFGMAGLWESWGQGVDAVRTCTIITGAPNPLVSAVHDRMPAILAPGDEAAWLDHATPIGQALQLLQPHPEREMEAVAVDRRVGNVANDEAGFIVPVAPA